MPCIGGSTWIIIILRKNTYQLTSCRRLPKPCGKCRSHRRRPLSGTAALLTSSGCPSDRDDDDDDDDDDGCTLGLSQCLYSDGTHFDGRDTMKHDTPHTTQRYADTAAACFFASLTSFFFRKSATALLTASSASTDDGSMNVRWNDDNEEAAS